MAWDRRMRDAAPYGCYACGTATIGFMCLHCFASRSMEIGLNDVLLVLPGIRITNLGYVLVLGISICLMLVCCAVKTIWGPQERQTTPAAVPSAAVYSANPGLEWLVKGTKCLLLVNCVAIWYIFWSLATAYQAHSQLQGLFQ